MGRLGRGPLGHISIRTPCLRGVIGLTLGRFFASATLRLRMTRPIFTVARCATPRSVGLLAFQIDQKNGYVRGVDAGDTSGLANGRRVVAHEVFPGLCPQADD